MLVRYANSTVERSRARREGQHAGGVHRVEHLRGPRARTDAARDRGPRGGDAARAARAPGGDRGAHLLRRGDAPRVHRGGLLPDPAAAALRRLRVRPRDLLPRDHRDRARLPVDRLVPVPRRRARPAGRLDVRRAGPGRVLRPRRPLRVRVLRRPGRRRPAARRRLRDRREVLLRLRDPVLDALHGPDPPASRGPAGPRAHVRHLRRPVRAPRRLARRARHARQRLAQHPDRRRVDPRVAHRARVHGRPARRGRHGRLAPARQPDVRRAHAGLLPRRVRRDHGRLGVRGARRVPAHHHHAPGDLDPDDEALRARRLPALPGRGDRGDRHARRRR